ncbi:MAG: UbiA prenyltransferase family protein [Gammaproteobacteria bacterium]|nr:UbiA prenyltransferase family protein [Gammaproteobacteria bacterium]
MRRSPLAALQPLLHDLPRWRHALRPYLHICHLHRPVDLILLLLPALWTVALAPGAPDNGALAALLLAATAVRCAAWVYNDLRDATLLPEAPESFIARGLVSRRDGWRLFVALLTIATLLLLLLDAAVLPWGGVALALLFGYPRLKRRTLLTQPYLGLCFAWMVAMAQLLVPGIAARSLWLLFVATLLWATANILLYTMPRRDYEERVGIGSLLTLLGDRGGVVVLLLQLLSVIALWLLGNQAGLGVGFDLGLLLALTLLPYQQWLLTRHPGSGATRAYRSNILFGLAILLGILW